MKLVIQRVIQAKVVVDGETIGKIDQGILVLLGIKHGDLKEQIERLLHQLIHLRIFSDENDKMNLSLLDIKGGLLVVPQFTLYANCSSGRRPSFSDAAPPDEALPLYELFVQLAKSKIPKVETGKFGADMKVHLINGGPITIILE